MGMKGLRVSCGDNFMRVDREKTGQVLGYVNWMKSRTPDGGYAVRVDGDVNIIKTEYACGTMPDREVVKLLLKKLEADERDAINEVNKASDQLAWIERAIAELETAIGSGDT